MTIVDTLAKTAWDACKEHIKYAYTFNRLSKSNNSLSSTVKGIYFFTKKGKAPGVNTCIYVGETFSKSKNDGISKRIWRHKKSLNDPEWKAELTGKKFLNSNLSVDVEMDLWYIDANDIGINDKQSSRSIEQLIQKHLKPVVWDIA
jgi:hypothetical protein